MVDYYAILGVEPACSQQDIKKTFRKRAKKIHPDVAGSREKADEEMRLLLKAYEVLSDPDTRREYDHRHSIVYGRHRFDYREFLKSRTDDPESQSKLIFYDLLHSFEDEALEVFDRLCSAGEFRLELHMDREDFMDCAYLLAEELEKRGSYFEAFRLLVSIIRHERQRPYFRHFFEEVVVRVRNLVCSSMPGKVDPRNLLEALEELVEIGLSKKDNAFFLKKIAEIYGDFGDHETASRYLGMGLALDSRLAGVKKLKLKIGYAE